MATVGVHPNISASSDKSKSLTIESSIDGISILWFDLNTGHQEDTSATKKHLADIDPNTQCFDNAQIFLEEIESLQDKSIVMAIIPGSSGRTLLPQLQRYRHVDSIFIYCQKPENYEPLLQEYSKLVCVCRKLRSLCDGIRYQVSQLQKHEETFISFNQQQRATKNLSNQYREFLLFQLFTYIIKCMPADEKSRDEMLRLCRDYYRNHERNLSLIGDFERNYTATDAIKWYTKQSFLYRLTNAALRTGNIDKLYAFRYFISDLSKSLADAHKRLVQSDTELLLVYRGVKLSAEELDTLKKQLGQVISSNTYFSTSRDQARARKFALKKTRRKDAIPVLFEISCNVKQSAHFVVVADIESLSEYPYEKEVLFDINTAFRIDDIQVQDGLYRILLSVSPEGQILIQDHIQLKRWEAEEMSPQIIFGRLMCDIGQYERSLKHLQKLLDSCPESNAAERAMIHLSMGRTYYHQEEWKTAEFHHKKAYDLMMKTDPPMIKQSAAALSSIGNELQRQNYYDEALKHYEKALLIRQKYYGRGHGNVAQSLQDIGSLKDDQTTYEEALMYYDEALTILNQHYPANHPQIACVYNNMALVYKRQENYTKALSLYKRALDVYQKFYPGSHPNIAVTLQNMAIVHRFLQDYQQAYDLYKQALDMFNEYYSPDHSQVQQCENCMKDLKKNFRIVDERK